MNIESGSASLHPLLLDPCYWRERLREVSDVPRRLLLFPRPDLGHPGVEVTELQFLGHDRTPLRALLARSSFAFLDVVTRLRAVPRATAAELDWDAVAQGFADLVFECRPGRRLEDRVLDVLRLVCCASTLEGIEPRRFEFVQEEGQAPADELLICTRLRNEKFC